MTTALRHAKRVVVGIIGATILLIGVLFLLIPGPGLIIIIVGLAVLASEFVWAKGLLEKARGHYDRVKHKITKRSTDNSDTDR